MSDVAIAPPPAAPSSAPTPAPANEVPVNPNPATPPQPVSNQAPEKPSSPAEGRRESIQKAFERNRAENPPKPREAKIGDNNPPEETKVERARLKPKDDRPETIDLKKRPTDQPQPQVRERGEHGHFTRRPDATPAPGTEPDATQSQRVPVKELPSDAPYREPPQRIAQHARADWHATPETVRGEVHRMHNEFNGVYQKLRGDHEVMNTIRPFKDLAEKQGTNLNKALINYVSMETKLRNDVVGGLDLIVDNLNLRHDDGTPQGRKLTLMDVAWHIINQTPEQRALVQQRNAAAAQKLQLDTAQRRIAALETQNKQAQYERAYVHTRGAVDQYAVSHPRLDELGDLIEAEVKLGFDLDTAYRRAELLRPATQAPQTRNPAAQTRSPSAQTRSDRSISGAPSGSNGAARPKPSGSRREAIASAIKRVGGPL